METNIIYNEDCLLTLSKMETDSVDLVITSPPYNMNLRIMNGKYCSRQIVKEFSTKYVGFNDNLPIDEFYKLHSSILAELIRVSKLVVYNIQIVTGSKRAFFKIIGNFSNNLKDIFVWDKGYAQPSMQSGVANRVTELLLFFEKDGISRMFPNANFDRGTLDDIWRITRETSVSKEHKACFPEKLVEEILINFSKENDIVYDPFMGTGTTAAVAKRMNRRYIGSEINEKYFDIIHKRLNENKVSN